MSCPGQFKCHKSSRCLSMDNMCDVIIDCMYGDDEFYCHPLLSNFCPENCTCVVFSIVCVHLDRFEYDFIVPFVYVDVSFSPIGNFHRFLMQFNQLIFFAFRQSKIENFYLSLASSDNWDLLRYVTVTDNGIRSLESTCFIGLTRLRLLNVKSVGALFFILT